MSKALVAYFSASGNTGRVAAKLAEAIGADVFQIQPQTTYSDSDLKWTNPLARCNREKLGKKDVPIAGTVENMADYDVIFLGFPIWYYGAPNIINTFVGSYDLTGKKLALFATSGGSDMGKTAEKLKPYLKGSPEIAAAKLFSPSAERAALADWAQSVL